MEPDFVPDAEPPVEIEQIDAAAQQDVLAVVDHLRVVAPNRPGSGAAAEKISRFVNNDIESRATERSGRGEARKAASNHSDLRH
jgi:hypothetical protein